MHRTRVYVSGLVGLHSQLVEILGHFLDLGVVVILDVSNEAGVVGEHEVDSSSLSSVSSSSSDSVDV